MLDKMEWLWTWWTIEYVTPDGKGMPLFIMVKLPLDENQIEFTVFDNDKEKDIIYIDLNTKKFLLIYNQIL